MYYLHFDEETETFSDKATQQVIEFENTRSDITAYRLKLKKVSSDNKEVLLSGAEFKLYQLSTDEDGVQIPGADGYYNLIATLTTGSDGLTSSVELTAGTYYLMESSAPDGYRAFEGLKEITIAGSTIRGPEEDSAIPDNAVMTDEYYILTVEDAPAAVLPATGGIGSQIYYIAGILLLLISGMLTLTKKLKT